jgi:predicted amidophosphoribosyltransferase
VHCTLYPAPCIPSSATISAVHMGGVLTAAVEALFPGLCPHCEQILPGGSRGLCGACWASLVPRVGSACPRCGAPVDDPADACLDCFRSSPPQRATVIWGEHDGVLRTAILSLKHHRRDDLAQPLGSRLAAAAAPASWASSIDAVCAVPSHPLRRIRRPWAAADLLASSVGRHLDKPVVTLLRRHGLHRQAGNSRARRLELPRRSFSASRRARGLTILLIDDVTTTGSTIRRAGEALLGAGAETVYCAILAHAPDSRRFS